MDQGNDKPFKTIEVVDSKTNQVCKVACMSCIRGHRTTSCGIPVCRNKVFWTVKRPGRPSNSCTCRYGATGGCKCVVARSACPHKAKKGEKRSGECRCDEQGRYCCLIEPDHWTALFALQKPTVEFCPNREDLETKQAGSIHMQHITTPSGHTVANSPGNSPGIMSVPGTPSSYIPTPHPSLRLPLSQVMPPPYDGLSPPSSSLTPRFGLMGLGAGQGSQHELPLDVLAWNGSAPQAPRNYQPTYTNTDQAPYSQQQQQQQQPPHNLGMSQTFDGLENMNGNHATIVATTLATPQPPIFDMQKMQADFDLHRLPSAICQSCGYSGCNCKACPPLFQNPFTGSWAQCCGRKHAREPQSTPEPHKIPRSSGYDGSQSIRAHAETQATANGGGCCGGGSEQQVSNHTTAPMFPPAGGGGGCCGSTAEPDLFDHDRSNNNPYQQDQSYANEFASMEQHQAVPVSMDFDQFMEDYEIPDLNGHIDINEYLDFPSDPLHHPSNTNEEPSSGLTGHENGNWVPAPHLAGEEHLGGKLGGDNLIPAPQNIGEEPPGASLGGGCANCACSSKNGA